MATTFRFGEVPFAAEIDFDFPWCNLPWGGLLEAAGTVLDFNPFVPWDFDPLEAGSFVVDPFFVCTLELCTLGLSDFTS